MDRGTPNRNPDADSPPLVRVPAKHASEICQYAGLHRDALALLVKDQTPRQLLDVLVAAKRYPDAIRFLAFALPWREAVWWGSMCVRMIGPQLGPRDEKALQTAVTWVMEPSERNRQEAEKAAHDDTAAGYVAKAVAWTGGSMTPPNLPVVVPGPELSHRAIDAAVTMAVLASPPDKVDERYRHVVALGIHVGRGKHLWAVTPSSHGQGFRP